MEDEAAVTARTRCGWAKLRECSELLYGRKYSLQLKGAINRNFAKSAILYGIEAWCLKECEMGILQRAERSMVRAICGVQLKDRKRYTDLMFMLGLLETIDQLAMVSSVSWYDHVLRREDGHVLRRALYFEVEGQRKKGTPKEKMETEEDMEKQVEEESVKIDSRREDALCRSKWSVGVNQIAAGLR